MNLQDFYSYIEKDLVKAFHLSESKFYFMQNTHIATQNDILSEIDTQLKVSLKKTVELFQEEIYLTRQKQLSPTEPPLMEDTLLINSLTGEKCYIDDNKGRVIQLDPVTFLLACQNNNYQFRARGNESLENNTYDYFFSGKEPTHFELDFSARVVTDNEITGKELSNSRHADFGIMGKMFLMAIFPDGSRYSIREYNISSGPYYNGPTPNKKYTGDKFVRTKEAGMQIYGETGWKVYMENHNGRTGLRIHPDTNSRGTAGCIGVLGEKTELKDLGDFFEDYITNGSHKIRVNFLIPNNPNYGNEGKAVKDPGQ